ncbi:intermembrane transport protein PqiB [Kosakonia oryzendophytica]|uniref:PqiB family protein n=1 Tax=Kosakonia oryzendophytica TaxID=1005665 RepID=UPI003D353101
MIRVPAGKRGRLDWKSALIWVIPLIALACTLNILLQARLAEGPDITLSFRSAAGLEAGKTEVKYKDVAVGVVTAITLSQEDDQVRVHVKLNRSAAHLARADTRFWVVRPRVSIGGVSGIDTLLSGAYIGLDKGKSRLPNYAFTGLENPPPVVSDVPGRLFTIDADDLGSLESGSPVYYRKVQVGKVTAFALRSDGKGVRLSVFIEAPYDHLVTAATRFWNASGIDLSAGSGGFRLKTGTVATILSGGIAFSTPDDAPPAPEAEPAIYRLAPDEESAMAPADGPPITFRLRFDRALHGLSIGAPVAFSSVVIGRVKAISLDYDPQHYAFPTLVDIDVYPSRMGNVLQKLPPHANDLDRATALFTRELVSRGLRAQVSTGSLLTGQLFVSIDFFPNAPAVPFDLNAVPLRIPTIGGSLDDIQQQVASIVNKVDKLPLASLGNNLNGALVELNKTLKTVNSQTLPAAATLMQHTQATADNARTLLEDDSPLVLNILQALQETTRTLKSLRGLSGQLTRNPESLLTGTPADPTHPDTTSQAEKP